MDNGLIFAFVLFGLVIFVAGFGVAAKTVMTSASYWTCLEQSEHGKAPL